MNREEIELPKWDVIPMDLIDPLARKIAVAWMECDDKDWIGNKHKLASDLMNYAHHICAGMKNAVAEQKEELARERAIGFVIWFRANLFAMQYTYEELYEQFLKDETFNPSQLK